jgi:PiT family inorganic phosphate transporter
LLGIALFGHYVEKTLGEELLTFGVSWNDVLTILLTVATLLLLGSLKGMPISTTHSVVGAAIGLGLYRIGIGGVEWSCVAKIVGGWIASPLLGLTTSAIMFKFLDRFMRDKIKTIPSKLKIAQSCAIVLLFTSAFAASFRAGNDIANATAFLAALYHDPLVRIATGIGMVLGLVVLGRRVVKSVGIRLVELDPITAVVVQLIVTLIMAVGTVLGFPLSGTHVLVNSVVGVGLARGTWINVKALREIFIAWCMTFPASAILSLALAYAGSAMV